MADLASLNIYQKNKYIGESRFLKEKSEKDTGHAGDWILYCIFSGGFGKTLENENGSVPRTR